MSPPHPTPTLAGAIPSLAGPFLTLAGSFLTLLRLLRTTPPPHPRTHPRHGPPSSSSLTVLPLTPTRGEAGSGAAASSLPPQQLAAPPPATVAGLTSQSPLAPSHPRPCAAFKPARNSSHTKDRHLPSEMLFRSEHLPLEAGRTATGAGVWKAWPQEQLCLLLTTHRDPSPLPRLGLGACPGGGRPGVT